jgi:hypothetical protein
MAKKIPIITAIIVVIIGLGATGVYLTLKQVGEEMKIDTSDWKVYRNEKYGFELRYPPSWVGLPRFPSSPPEAECEATHLVKDDLGGKLIAINVIRNSPDMSLWEFSKKTL